MAPSSEWSFRRVWKRLPSGAIGLSVIRSCGGCGASSGGVPESAIVHATMLAFLHAKLVIEPAAATALAVAAGLVDGVDLPGGDIGVLITGGNIDAGLASSLLASCADTARTL